ncbi:hypothetical protein QCA50_019121 [Cerrena zonata]|uniref:Uncharacterized protein n=1 Tax=Cerrena zonata TaxID=2478898 RepID=A0AAW0FC40_9APHY
MSTYIVVYALYTKSGNVPAISTITSSRHCDARTTKIPTHSLEQSNGQQKQKQKKIPSPQLHGLGGSTPSNQDLSSSNIQTMVYVTKTLSGEFEGRETRDRETITP